MRVDPNDTQYEEVRIKSVEPSDNGWAVDREDGWTFYVQKKHRVEPKAGDLARFYGDGIGSIIRGLTLNGVVVFYQTPEAHELEMQRKAEESRQEQRREAEAMMPELDAKYDALPLVFQQRVAAFRRNNADFRWQFEPYEMLACVDAVKIAAACQTPDDVRAFHALSYEQQLERVPDMDKGHSGNSFDVACRLALLYLSKPEAVVESHGAMCGLVGCTDYGCLPAYLGKAAQA